MKKGLNSLLLLDPVKCVCHSRADLTASYKVVVRRGEALLELFHLGLGRLGRALHDAKHARADGLPLVEARRRVAVTLFAPHERHVFGVALLADQRREREQFTAVGAGAGHGIRFVAQRSTEAIPKRKVLCCACGQTFPFIPLLYFYALVCFFF